MPDTPSPPPPVRFNDRARTILENIIRAVLNEVPEVEGIGVSITYGADLGEPSPQCLIMGDIQNVDLLCRMGKSAARLCETLAAGVSEQFQEGRAIAAQLHEQINDASQSIQASTRTGAEEPSRPSDAGLAPPASPDS